MILNIDGKRKTIYNWQDLPLVLDPYTVALVLGVTEQTIFNWLKAGKLKANKIGNKWFIDREYVRSLVQVQGVSA